MRPIRFATHTCWRVILLLLLAPGIAGAWGLSTELNESWAQARLVFPALRHGAIRYCVQNEAPTRFDTESVAIQVAAALRLWLSAVHDLGGADVKVERVSCVVGEFDLLVRLGPETQWKNLGSYQLSSWDDKHYYSLVKFDTGFLSPIGGKSYAIEDFKNYSGGLAGEAELIRRVSVDHPETVQAFASERQLDPNAVFWSTFPSLLHELGHSFGLCDTYDSTVKDQCDPAFASATQPSSVMKDSNYLYLADDDVTAIRRLFQRFR